MIRTSRLAVPVLAAVLAGIAVPGAAAAAPTTGQTGRARACTVVGTSGNDRLTGTTGHDVICGLGGNDVISGGDGNDIIDGGSGNDIIVGGRGDDSIGGGAGDDRVQGGDGNDTVTGDRGNDRIDGGAGNDRVQGGDGNDTVTGDRGNDRIDGGTGDDRVQSGDGNDVVNGDPGDDRLDGGPGDDRLTGGDGADDIRGGTGLDTCRRDAADVSPVTSCSDLAAPKVDESSVQWISAPTLDNSAERTLRLRVRVTDDRSGVAENRGAVWVTTPDGPLIALQDPRLISGTRNDGILEFVGTLPAYAPAGAWRIREIAVVDRVDRSTDLLEPDLPGFTVTGEADVTAPVVDESSVRWISAATLDNSVERTLRLRVRVTDDRSGVAENRGAVWVTTPDGPLIALQDPRLISGTRNDGILEFVGTLPAYAPAGAWHIREIAVVDRVDRSTDLLEPDLPGFTVTGVADLAAPVVDESSVQWVSAPTLDNSAQRILRLRMRVTDDRSGVAEGPGAVWVTTPDGPLIALQDPRLISGTRNDGILEFVGTLPAYAPAGAWHIREIAVVDRVGRTADLLLPELPGFTVTDAKA
ncbi:calcium-binding protein [Actinoplanes sp. NPDC049548]|uniref:calcium-binding protein n=1 Tax=Actinoplanes sp. NPDC049548 TaxID=3155152 RepID=UPI0034240592